MSGTFERFGLVIALLLVVVLVPLATALFFEER